MSAAHPWPWSPIRLSEVDDREGVRAVTASAGAAIAEALDARPEWKPPPYDPKVLAEVLGIPIVEATVDGAWDALLVPAADGPRIVCNAAVRSRSRRRFSVAHELAHLFFEDAEATFRFRAARREDYDRDPSARRLERLCDRGAAELLMPRQALADDDARGPSAATIARIAATFGTSLQAAALRTLELAGVPAAVGFFHLAGRSLGDPSGCTGERGPVLYRVKRVFHGPGFPFLFPEGKSVPKDSIIYQASLQRKELQGMERFELGGRWARLRVTAFPLHKDPCLVTEPPTVCATFEC